MTILYNRKSVSNFNFCFNFLLKLTYTFMIKMYDNMQEKYKSSVFQILQNMQSV